tara:strand:- start:851 stop:1594 length:744 start_codon:yes stop_codon:yes gene_type:complete
MSFSEYRASGGRFNPKTEYERLYQLKLKHGLVTPVMEGYEQYGLKYTSKRGTLNINNTAFNGIKDYKSKFVTTKTYVKGKGYVGFDSRTGKIFDAKSAKEYITEKNDIAAKAHYLKVYGTETPVEDMNYLNKLIRNTNRMKHTVNPLKITRDMTPIEGEEGETVFSKADQKRNIKLNNEIAQAKKGTSYEKKENAELEYKINQAVTNKESEPINLKDVSATSGYVDTRRKQLEIDKQFNTSGSGVVY